MRRLIDDFLAGNTIKVAALTMEEKLSLAYDLAMLERSAATFARSERTDTSFRKYCAAEQQTIRSLLRELGESRTKTTVTPA